MVGVEIPCKAGISLKTPHYEKIISEKPSVPWFEVHPENLKVGTTLRSIETIRQFYPLSFHGVGLSLGSIHLNDRHLEFLKEMCDRLEPGFVSEHVSWSYVEGIYINDLLPLPYTDESLQILAENIHSTQDYLKRQILIENPSTYVQFSHSTYTEEDFIKEVARRTGCGILLDINNVYVSSYNHGLHAETYIKELAQQGSIKEIHIAGHKKFKVQDNIFLIDHHGSQVSSDVWNLYRYALSLMGPVPTLIEWDNHIPAFDILWGESKKADLLMETINESIDLTATV